MKQIFCIFLSFILLSCVNNNSEKEPEPLSELKAVIGKKVPNFKLALLNDPHRRDKDLYEYEADIVILDFWATWCAPCINAMPKLEQLQKEFGGRIKVLSITDEGLERVRSFLEHKPVELTFVHDSTKTLGGYFKHRSIPHYVLLNKNKEVIAITSGENITSENLNKILVEEEVSLPEKKDRLNFDPNESLVKNSDNLLFQSVLTPYKEGRPSMSKIDQDGIFANRRIFVSNLTIPMMFQIAHQYPSTRILKEFLNPDKYDFKNTSNRYSYELVVPENAMEEKFKIMQEELKRIFNLKIGIENRRVPVLILKRNTDAKIELKESSSAQSPQQFVRYGEGITIVNDSISKLCGFLENNFRKPIIDETNYNRRYDIEVKWQNENPNKIHEELANYGLCLEEGEREVEMLILND